MWQNAGFLKEEADVEIAMQKLGSLINNVQEKYRSFSAGELMYKPAFNKWSKQEILGHLIDSAINNLKRFTEIQFLSLPYIVQSYQQENLVLVNNYQHLPLAHLLDLWAALNKQIIYVVENIPAEKFSYPVNPQYDNNETKNLRWIICDYVAHMEHHMRQVS